MIDRHIADTIEETRKHFPVVIVTGPRQVGKTTLLINMYEDKGYNYVSLDDTLERSLAISDPRTFLEVHPYPLIIDEAQKAPELFDEIERIVNGKRSKEGNAKASGMYILTGSTRHLLLEKAEESLAGRCGIISMWPLSISEIMDRENNFFLSDLKKINKRADIDFDVFEYICRGSLPQLYDDKETSRDIFYSSYISTYLEKDVREILNVYDIVKFTNFFKLLASNIGQEVIYEYYAKDLGIDKNTIKSWIGVLVKTGVVYLIQPYNEQSITKRIIKRPKMYFFDTGLASYLVGIDSKKTLEKSFMKGRFFENFAMNEILKSFHNSGINQDMYFYRDSNQNEIDLVYVNEGKLNLVEMKSGQKFSIGDVPGFRQLDKTRFEKGNRVIVCTTDKLSAIDEGVLLYPIKAI